MESMTAGGMGRDWDKNLTLPKGGVNCLNMVSNRNVSENINIHWFSNKTFTEECCSLSNVVKPDDR